MKAKQFEGYIITDEIKIGSARYAIGEKGDGAKSYVTVESRSDVDDKCPHYLQSRIAAEVDLIKRTVMQMRYELHDFATDMQDMLKKEANLLEL